MPINLNLTIQFILSYARINMQHEFQNMQQLIIQHDKRINSLIPENKVSNKSKNPAPYYDERTA